VSLAVLVVVGTVPPLRHAALHGATAAALRVAVRWAPAVPPFDSLSANTQIVAADGRLLATLREEDRRPLPLADIPVPVRRAVLAAEDEDFYDHAGIDPVAVGRAAWRNLRGGRQGGSTITQQLAKTNFTTGERNFDRKFDEALIAAVLEHRHTKDELLERYLNQVYFGEQAYGLASAARTFFGADPAALTVGQAATLAGKIRAPDRLDPRTGPGPVIRRRDAVLANMAEEGWLTATQLEAARAEPLVLAPPQPQGGALLAPHFVELVKREAKTLEALGENAEIRFQRLATAGYRVETTLDPAVFEHTVHAVSQRLGRPEDPLVATATVEPGTGAIRSLFGGLSFASNQFDAASLGARQPGSAFKPFVYLAALRKGIDPRSTFSGASGRKIACYGDRRVQNSGNRSAGRRIDVDRALVQSVNVVFVDLGCEVGVDAVLQAARDAGVPKAATEAQGAVFLGGLDRGVSALTMAAAYATFAADGVYAEPYAIARIVDGEGRVIYEREPVQRRAFQASEVGVLNRMLQQVVTSGTGRGAAIGRPVAGKTGTTQDNGDAWFVGYVPQLSTAVWVGYEPRRPMWWVHGRSVSGGSFPASIFADVMRAALGGVPVRPILTADPGDLDLKLLRGKSVAAFRRRAKPVKPLAPAAEPASVTDTWSPPPPAPPAATPAQPGSPASPPVSAPPGQPAGGPEGPSASGPDDPPSGPGGEADGGPPPPDDEPDPVLPVVPGP
jgi:membrane peptidoglycan carboxypeptidase